MKEAVTKADRLTKRRRKRLTPFERADIALLEKLRPLLRKPAAKEVGAIGNLADEPPLLAFSAGIAALGMALGKRPIERAGLRMILAHLVATEMKTIGKDHIDRSRPDALLEKKRYRMEWGGSKLAELRSFPSGHTAGAVALARAACRELAIRPFAYGAAAVLGGLQVLRRAHFPGDVAAGTVVGVAAEALAHRIFGRLSAAR